MTRLRILIAALLCLAFAGSALAADAPYKSGKYKGKTGQTNPQTGKKYTLTFTIAKGKISNVRTFTRDRCPDDTHLRVEQNAFKTTKLDSKGRFTLRAGTPEQPAVMKGKVSGSKASGTITDRTNDTAKPPSGVCKASTKWSATLVKLRRSRRPAAAKIGPWRLYGWPPGWSPATAASTRSPRQRAARSSGSVAHPQISSPCSPGARTSRARRTGSRRSRRGSVRAR